MPISVDAKETPSVLGQCEYFVATIIDVIDVVMTFLLVALSSMLVVITETVEDDPQQNHKTDEGTSHCIFFIL